MATIRGSRRSKEELRWEGVSVEPYAPGDPRAGTRQVLIGPEDQAENFALRYFELVPGTRSKLETHAHDHGVYVLRGRGRVTLEDGKHELGPGDVVYVEPNELHCFEADGEDSLGFLCVVPARR